MELSSDLLGKLYATVENRQRWTPLLDDLRRCAGAGGAVVQLLDARPDRLNTIWQARDSRSTANSDLHDRCLNNPDNPRLRRQTIAGLPPAEIADLTWVGSDRRLFTRYPHLLADIRERLSQIGLGHAFWVSFPICEARRFTLILHREAGDDRDLTQVEEGALRELLPHMQQAAKLWLSLEKAACRTNALENALDRLDLALVVCDAELRIHWSNTAAESLIARGRSLRMEAGRLGTSNTANDAVLRRLIGKVLSGAADSQVGVIGSDECHPTHVRASTCAGTWSPLESGQVALFLSQPSSGNCLNPADLCELFGLTPAEARLAVALASGASLANYSDGRGISIGTARNQLKQVLSKTGTRGQSELVRTLCNSSASRAR